MDDKADIQMYLGTGTVFGDIGLAQLALQDIDGARCTAEFLPSYKECPSCGAGYHRFLRHLAATLVRVGRRQQADDVLRLHYGGNLSDTVEGEIATLLSVAHVENAIGNQASASADCRTALARSVEGRSPSGAIEVAITQVSLGNTGDSRKSRGLIDSLLTRLSPDGVERCIVWAQLAQLDAALGDDEKARRWLMLAQESLQRTHCRSVDAWHSVAVGFARLGNTERAAAAVERIEDSQRSRAYMDVGLVRWSAGDLDGAEATCKLDTSSNYDPLIREEVLQEIAESRAELGQYRRALGIVNELTNPTRRATGILRVAAVMAARGQRTDAGTVVAKVDFPKLDSVSGIVRFAFADPRTWTMPYEEVHAYLATSRGLAEDMDADLVAAAVRCHIMLVGAGLRFEESKNGHWNPLRAAEAQAMAGDVVGALRWAEGLARGKRICAVIGAAEGYAAYLLHRQKGWHGGHTLSPRHILVRRYNCMLLSD
jgi:hypothetical protein